MVTRRTFFFSLVGIVAATPVWAADPAPAADKTAEEPTIKLIKSKPPVLDFGDGVKVPCTKDAFLTLWESPTYWLTFGAGMSPQSARSKGVAMDFAVASMKLLLVTLAFAPDRLEKVEGNGWRLNAKVANDYVRGEIELPGKPSPPVTDASLGFGNSDSSLFIGSLPSVGRGMSGPAEPSITGVNPALLGKVNSFCIYVVKKSDISLDDVRKRTQLEKN